MSSSLIRTFAIVVFPTPGEPEKSRCGIEPESIQLFT
jgi:hypothetical protein